MNSRRPFARAWPRLAVLASLPAWLGAFCVSPVAAQAPSTITLQSATGGESTLSLRAVVAQPSDVASPSDLPIVHHNPAPATAAARLKLIASDTQPLLMAAQVPATTVPTGRQPAPEFPAPPMPPGAPDRSSGFSNNSDPTVPGPQIRELLGNEAPDRGAPPALPAIRLRARIVVRNQPAMALVEIGGDEQARLPSAEQRGPGAANLATGVFRVIRQGDEFAASGDGQAVIRVVTLTNREIILEHVNRKMLMRLD